MLTSRESVLSSGPGQMSGLPIVAEQLTTQEPDCVFEGSTLWDLSQANS